MCGSDGCDKNGGCGSDECDIGSGCDHSDGHDDSGEHNVNDRCITVTSLMAAADVWQ